MRSGATRPDLATGTAGGRHFYQHPDACLRHLAVLSPQPRSAEQSRSDHRLGKATVHVNREEGRFLSVANGSYWWSRETDDFRVAFVCAVCT